MFEVTLQSKKSNAFGRVAYGMGPIETPVFVPVGTQATVKGVPVDALHHQI